MHAQCLAPPLYKKTFCVLYSRSSFKDQRQFSHLEQHVVTDNPTTRRHQVRSIGGLGKWLFWLILVAVRLIVIGAFVGGAVGGSLAAKGSNYSVFWCHFMLTEHHEGIAGRRQGPGWSQIMKRPLVCCDEGVGERYPRMIGDVPWGERGGRKCFVPQDGAGHGSLEHPGGLCTLCFWCAGDCIY
jgi:hypothetical protein